MPGAAGFGAAAGQIQRGAEAGIGGGVVRLQAEGFAVLLHGGGMVASVVQRAAQPVMRFGIAGISGDGLLEQGNRADQTALVIEYPAALEECRAAWG